MIDLLCRGGLSSAVWVPLPLFRRDPHLWEFRQIWANFWKKMRTLAERTETNKRLARAMIARSMWMTTRRNSQPQGVHDCVKKDFDAGDEKAEYEIVLDHLDVGGRGQTVAHLSA